ncbi:hypothetical protein RAD15_04515 [Bradyrhizobium sp. 14AA]
MRALLLILISLPAIATSAAASEILRLPPAERPQAGKTLPLKSKAGAARANSCAAYGPRFTMIEATGTCVKIGGSISIDTTIRR